MENLSVTCQNCKTSFAIEAEDAAFYQKMKVPAPTFCPQCRMIRRFAWRNERFLFRHEDARTKEMIFSGFPAATPATIYALDFWISDNWDPMTYGRDYDFTQPFFTQFREFLYSVPWPAKSAVAMIDSEYCEQSGHMKNCYLCFDSGDDENCAYLVGCFNSKDSMDLYESRGAQLCYDDYMVDDSYRVFYSINCEDSNEIWFSNYLVGCTNCFGCVNLRQKSYCIFNKQYSKEEYQKFLQQYNLGSYTTVTKLKKEAHDFWLKFPMRFTMGFRNTNSTGEHIENCKNAHECYCIHGGENLKYCQLLEAPVTDSYDYTSWGGNASRMYESLTCGQETSDLKFCWECWPSSRSLEYSAFCRGSSNCFGCVGLKKKQYCIFNKQYSKEEYEALVSKIIEQMNAMPYTDSHGHVYTYGEFFPSEFSPFAYNETLAQDFFPLTAKTVATAGFSWREPDTRAFEATLEDATALPDDIKDAQDEVIKEIIKCASCAKPYRIVTMELEFYRRVGVPLPHTCPECRFRERFVFVNPPQLWSGKCECAGTKAAKGEYENLATHFHGAAACPNTFQTSYKPGRPEIVYCEQCYSTEAV